MSGRYLRDANSRDAITRRKRTNLESLSQKTLTFNGGGCSMRAGWMGRKNYSLGTAGILPACWLMGSQLGHLQAKCQRSQLAFRNPNQRSFRHAFKERHQIRRRQ